MKKMTIIAAMKNRYTLSYEENYLLGYMKGRRIGAIGVSRETLIRCLQIGCRRFCKATLSSCHELSHCFGVDASSVFSRALTDIIAMITKKSESLTFFNNLWIEHFDNQNISN